jgi:hypothetical protein
MNMDPAIRNTLFKALDASVGNDPNITASGDTVTLASGGDSLECDTSVCTLTWNTTSPGYPVAANIFETSLYDALNNWATHDGVNDPAIHRSIYARTGSVQISVTGDSGSTDYVSCALIVSNGSTVSKNCTLVVSDSSTSADTDLQTLYNGMSAGKTFIGSAVQTLLNLVKSNQFLPSDNTSNGNGLIESIHTLDTDFISDQYAVSSYHAYVNPILNSKGQFVAEGLMLTFTGSLDSSGVYTLQQAEAQNYALNGIIH